MDIEIDNSISITPVHKSVHDFFVIVLRESRNNRIFGHIQEQDRVFSLDEQKFLSVIPCLQFLFYKNNLKYYNHQQSTRIVNKWGISQKLSLI